MDLGDKLKSLWWTKQTSFLLNTFLFLLHCIFCCFILLIKLLVDWLYSVLLLSKILLWLDHLSTSNLQEFEKFFWDKWTKFCDTLDVRLLFFPVWLCKHWTHGAVKTPIILLWEVFMLILRLFIKKIFFVIFILTLKIKRNWI